MRLIKKSDLNRGGRFTLSRQLLAFFAAASLLVITTGCAVIGIPETIQSASKPSASKPSASKPIEDWANVLRNHENAKGQVDFKGVQSNPDALHRYVSYVAETDPQQVFSSADERLAHHINAYNAVAMFAVLKNDIHHTNAGLTKVKFFLLQRYRIASSKKSLYRYEKEIRALGDPRIHFALNCMSISCPILPQVPFAASSLNKVLDREAKQFFATPSNLKVVAGEKKIYVSEILKFYKGEFITHAGSLIAYINQYIDEDIPESYDVAFIPYDWTINKSP